MRLLIGMVLLTALILAEDHFGSVAWPYPDWLPFIGLFLCGLEDVSKSFGRD